MAPPAVVLDWPVGTGTGWGVFGLNLALELSRQGDVQPLLLTGTDPAALHPIHRHVLGLPLAQQRELQALLDAAGPAGVRCDYPVLRALGNGLTRHDLSARLLSGHDVGVVFFEDTVLMPDALARGREFATIIAGSEWNGAVLRAAGLDQVQVVQQGIDPTLFHPAPRAGVFGERFVVFSGGKLEYRKGQDIVVAAFRIFRQRHPDAVLLTAWHNAWPQTMVGVETTGRVQGRPGVDAQGRLGVTEWLVRNGIPADACVDLGPLPNYLMGPAVREADVALFPNRAEGGTNLVAMEAMACGVPAILSANTGHLDLLRPGDGAWPLARQGPVRGQCPLFRGTEGWGECDVDEVVEALELAYQQRDAFRRRGEAGARFLHAQWTWRRQAERLLHAALAPVPA